MKRLLLFAFLVSICLNSKAQSWQDTARMIDHFFDRYKPNNPGCQLSISRNGKLIYSRAWGLADLERHVPYTTETITEAGSITKQFTAAAILQLKERGELQLDDRLSRFVPTFPHAREITIRQLLNQTSGLPDYTQSAGFIKQAAMDK